MLRSWWVALGAGRSSCGSTGLLKLGSPGEQMVEMLGKHGEQAGSNVGEFPGFVLAGRVPFS
jgi:hypothetical protein